MMCVFNLFLISLLINFFHCLIYGILFVFFYFEKLIPYLFWGHNIVFKELIFFIYNFFKILLYYFYTLILKINFIN
jgi:hypothetical protein